MIRLDDVTKRYGRRRGAAAVDGVTLHIPAGSVWAVVGPNGAGKSTLLGLVLGFLRPTRGSVSIGELSPRQYLGDEGVGYLPERFALPGDWRLGDAMRMLARLGGGTAEEAQHALVRFGLEAHAAKRVADLSRGLLQRAGIAQALLGARRLIVLDEPTEGLDPLWRIRLRDVIAELHGQGSTVIIASHDLAEVERVAERAVLLDRGQVRDIIDARPTTSPSRYRVRLASPFPNIRDIFPHAEEEDTRSYLISASGPPELSERLGALIGLGAVLETVEPLRLPLEDRVRSALEEA